MAKYNEEYIGTEYIEEIEMYRKRIKELEDKIEYLKKYYERENYVVQAKLVSDLGLLLDEKMCALIDKSRDFDDYSELPD